MNRLLAILVIAIIAGYGCLSQGTQPGANNSTNGTDTSNAITQQMCEAAHGHWNDGKSGRHCCGATEGTACDTPCVSYCECGGIAGFGCPASYVCMDYLPSKDTPDAMGICKKTSE